MLQGIRRISTGFVTALAVAGLIGATPASAADRFEVASIKAVRPILANTVAALEKHDVKAAKSAFDGYDSAWNGVEVYISTRDKTLYSSIEQDYQAKLTKELLDAPNPDAATVLPDAKAMLGKFDEAIALVSKSPPLNAHYDDVARLRIVRAYLREVTPALKDGNIAKARQTFDQFDTKWDSIEDLIKDRSMDDYVTIEKNMISVEQALMPAKPDTAMVTALVKNITDPYNAILGDIVNDAKAGK